MSEVRLRLVAEAPPDLDDWEPGMVWPLMVGDGEAEGHAGYSVVLCRHTDAAGKEWPVVWHTKTPGAGPQWDVTGEPPNITVSPSINVIGIWHGWIRDGVLVPV